jgi:predicted phage replisome organizer
MENKRYYWIKLKTDFFEDDKIDFIMSQKNGSEYIVLYQLLCLKSANNNGCLGSKIGDILLKWNEEKIQRECKYFDVDTIRVALSLYKSLGLVYEGDDELIKISNFDDMVGSETKWAKYKRDKRELENVQLMSNKILEIEIDKDIDINNKENNNINVITKEKKRFSKPTIEEINEYCRERNNGISGETFYDFYESKGWKVGNTPMKDWKACVRTWEQKHGKNVTVKVEQPKEKKWYDI